jgi:hypothetical protein
LGGPGCRPTLRGTRCSGGEGGVGGTGLDHFGDGANILAELAELAERLAHAGGIIRSVLFERPGPPGGVVGPGLSTSQVSPSPVEPNVDDHTTPCTRLYLQPQLTSVVHSAPEEDSLTHHHQFKLLLQLVVVAESACQEGLTGPPTLARAAGQDCRMGRRR